MIKDDFEHYLKDSSIERYLARDGPCHIASEVEVEEISWGSSFHPTKSLQKSEKTSEVDRAALTQLEKSLETLQNERDRLNDSMERAHIRFSRDIEKLNAALQKAEDHYKGLEAKALLEVDCERQKVLSLSKDITALKSEIKTLQKQNHKDLSRYHTERSATKERLGQLKPS